MCGEVISLDDVELYHIFFILESISCSNVIRDCFGIMEKETLGKKYNLFPHFLILNGGQNGDFLIYVLLRLANTRIR